MQEKLNEWTRKAKKALEQSELYAPESTYGYVSECKVYRDCIKTAKKLLHEKNYDFTEKDPWCEYVDWFNAAMRNVLELIRNVDESNIEEISSLRQFHMQIVKHTDDDASLYYKRSFDNELNQSLQLHYSQMFFWATFYANEGTTNTKDISKTYPKKKKILFNDNLSIIFCNLALSFPSPITYHLKFILHCFNFKANFIAYL